MDKLEDLDNLITAFKSMHPNVHVNMLVCNSGAAEKLILDHHVDLGFVEGEVWFQDELVFITRITDQVKEEYDVKITNG